MRGTRFLVATAAAAALIVGAATVGGATSTADETADAEAGRHGFSRLFGALLTGAAEVPGPGDADGAAAAVVRINLPSGRICVIGFDTNQIDDPTLFHIHEGVATVPGPVVVDFTHLLPTGLGCVKAGGKLARAIVQNPDGYYFNVHNPAFMGGAVRGTLVGL
jgi:hypothetical protein